MHHAVMRHTASPLACLRQVQVRCAGHAALKGIDLQVRAGQVLALLGRNGAGKSTAIRVLPGFTAAALDLARRRQRRVG